MLRNCADCNQVYVHAVNKLCPDCTKSEMSSLLKLKSICANTQWLKFMRWSAKQGLSWREFGSSLMKVG